MSSKDQAPLYPAYGEFSNSDDPSNVYGKQSNQYPCQNLQPPGGAQFPSSPGGVYGQTSVANPPPYTIDSRVPHKDWTIPSILAAVCCFWPIGLPAIYYASKANSEAFRGNVAATILYSRYARNLVIASVVLGIFCLILIVVNVVLKNQIVYTYRGY